MSQQVATGQEIVDGKNNILQGQGKLREFYFKLGETDILKKSHKKLK